MEKKYKFIKVPTCLFFCLDNNCRCVLTMLVQLSDVYGDFEGWFFRSNRDLEQDTNLSSNVLKGALDALYKNHIIDIVPQQKGRGKKQECRKYKVITSSFIEYDKHSIDEIRNNPKYQINTSDYKHCNPTWMSMDRGWSEIEEENFAL